VTEHLTPSLLDALDGAILLVGGPPGSFRPERGAKPA